MKNKLISGILSAVMLFSVFTGMVKADAVELLKETFDGMVDSKWITLVSGSGVSFSVDDGYLKANTSNGNSNRVGAVDVTNIAEKDYMSLSFDFKESNCNSNYTLKHGVGVKDAAGNEVFSLTFPNHRGKEAVAQLNGSDMEGVILPNTTASGWYTVHASMDFKTHRMSYKITAQGSEEPVYSKDAVPMLSAAAGVNSLEFYINRGYDTDFVAVDNFVLSETDNPNIPEPPIVESITVQYEKEGSIVKSGNVPLTNAFEGESISYISSNYIKGDDDKYYYIASDYNEDKKNVILNDTSKPVNSALKMTADNLSSDTVIKYNVSEAKDIVYFAELEEPLETAAVDAPNGRYMASGGKMTGFSGTKPFFEIPSEGYYQVLLVGCPQAAGTGIFKSEATANAAVSYDDNAVVSFYSTKNDYYGIYSCGVGYFEAGDNLTIRGFGPNSAADKLDYVAVKKITSGKISGPDGMPVLPGGMSVQFQFDSTVKDEPVWSVEGEGATIDQNGMLTVHEDAPEGTILIHAVIGDHAVTAQKLIEVKKPVISSYEFKGTTTLNIADQKKYWAENVKDQFGNDITSFVDTAFTSSDECIKVDSNGNAQAVTKGSAAIEMTMTVGEAVEKAQKNVISDLFYVTADAVGDETTVDLSGLANNDNIIGYRVTAADGAGKQIREYTLDAVDRMPVQVAEDGVQVIAGYSVDGVLESVETKNIKAGDTVEQPQGKRSFIWKSLMDMTPVKVAGGMKMDTRDADKIEVSPVYKYDFSANGGEDVKLPGDFADGEYDFTITKSTTQKLDLYVNGYMIGNNINEPGVGRTMTDADRIYSVNDILVDEGTITISKLDCSNMLRAGIDSVVISKAPSVAERKKKLYIIGDSLVSDYYGELAGTVGTGRSGWGQVMQNFVSNGIETVNWANAGQYASGLLVTAFPGIIHTAHRGDYLIIESGWNDLRESNYDEMYESVLKMVDVCEMRGIRPVLVTPNASSSTWLDKSDVRLSSAMRAAAKTAQGKYNDVIFVDLAQESYDYLHRLYGDDVDIIDANFSLGTAGGDKLHLSYLAAMKWAEVVAQGMADAGVGFIDKEFSWSVTDKQGNEITTQVK